MDPETALTLQNPALIIFRSAHEICADRLPSVPVPVLVFLLAAGLRCNARWAQWRVRATDYRERCWTTIINQSVAVSLCRAAKRADQTLHVVDHVLSARRTSLWCWGPKTGPVVRKRSSPSIHQRSPGGSSFRSVNIIARFQPPFRILPEHHRCSPFRVH